MKTFTLFFILILQTALCMAETEPSATQTREPDLYDHFLAMEQTQERLSQLSLEEKERLQPQIRKAELEACDRLRRDRQNGVQDSDYRRQGGDVLVANVLQFEQYCQTLR